MLRPITADDPESRSADLVGENLARLRELFPEAFTESGVDFDVLKQLLGGAVDEREEKYGLNWHGKRQARQLALTPSTGTLLPRPDESVDWDTTQNLIIEGDNLEVLKLLQKSYAGKVKLIYIDPPYNTGKDFVYPDNYRDSMGNYLAITGQTDEEGRKVGSNTEASGRFHTDWLNMMYPRLKLAKTLLAESGVIFISIDDNEIQNIRAIADEVFGPENFVATVVWQKVYSPKNTARHFSEDHDYLVVYARNSELWTPELLGRTPEMEARYDNPDEDPRGAWKPADLSARNYYGEGTYAITSPSGRLIPGPPPGRYWAVSQTKFADLDRDHRIWWGRDGNNAPAVKRFLSEVKAGKVPQTMWFYKDAGHNQEGKKELLDVLPFTNSEDVFETPKPTRLIRRVLDVTTTNDEHALVIDFFAGSGTTAHAVMAQNASDGGNRRFICVQLDAPLPNLALLTDGVSLRSLSDITKERVRRAARNLGAQAPLLRTDSGFRVLRLAHSNLNPWLSVGGQVSDSILLQIHHLRDSSTEQDILFELLLKLGLELTVPIDQRTIASKTVHSVAGGVLFACLAERIATDEVEPLALGIAAWHRELAPAGETQVVVRDSGFADDVAKTNFVAILQQHGLANVRSL